MANVKHAVFRSDLMSGTNDEAALVSLKYFDADGNPTDIDNGSVVRLTELLDNEREVWRAVAPAANTPVDEIAIVGSAELLYDERQHNLDEFVNEAGTAARGYIPRKRNIWSVTKEALTGSESPKKGNIVELTDGNKLNVVETATSGSTVIGEIIDVEVTNRYTYYVILCK